MKTDSVIEPYVDHISLTRFDSTGKKILQPDGCWDLTLLRQSNGKQIVRMYQATKAVVIEHSAGDEILGISFKPGVFIPFLPHEARHDKGMGLPFFGPDYFMIGSDRFEVPSPDNSPQLVQRLVQKGLLQTHSSVLATLGGQPPCASERTLQRAFLQGTGVTQKYFVQIKRAQEAVALLRAGIPALRVAVDLGYSDQAHMTKSLKYIMGQTPRQICQAQDTTPWRSAPSYKMLATFSG